MPRLRPTRLNFEAAVAKKNGEYRALGEYKGPCTRIEMLHVKCGKTYMVRPHDFLRGSYCVHCCYNDAPQEPFKQALRQLVGDWYELRGRYVNNYSEVTLWHKKCGKTFKIAPVHFLYSEYRCPHCARRPIKNVAARIAKYWGKNYELISKRVQRKMVVRHIPCGQEIKVEHPLIMFEKRPPDCPCCGVAPMPIKHTYKLMSELKLTRPYMVKRERFEDVPWWESLETVHGFPKYLIFKGNRVLYLNGYRQPKMFGTLMEFLDGYSEIYMSYVNRTEAEFAISHIMRNGIHDATESELSAYIFKG